MNRIEKFALATGITGLIADTLTLGTFIITRVNSATASEFDMPMHVSVYVILTASLIYSWLLVSWFLVRRIYLYFCERNRTVRWEYWSNFRLAHSKILLQYTVGSVFGIAVLILPLTFLLLRLWFSSADSNILGDVAFTVFAEGIIGFAIIVVITFLMPVIYPDVEADLFTMLRLLKPDKFSRRRR